MWNETQDTDGSEYIGIVIHTKEFGFSEIPVQCLKHCKYNIKGLQGLSVFKVITVKVDYND